MNPLKVRRNAILETSAVTGRIDNTQFQGKKMPGIAKELKLYYLTARRNIHARNL